jgi:hypothetical protein
MSSKCRLHLKCDGTRAETRFRLSTKRTGLFKSAGASFQSITVNRGVRISGSNAGYTMFRGSVKSPGTHSICQFPLHFPSRASLCAITFQLDTTVKRPACNLFIAEQTSGNFKNFSTIQNGAQVT